MDTARGRVADGPSVEAFDTTEWFASDFFDLAKSTAFEQFGFQSGPETLCLSVILTIAFFLLGGASKQRMATRSHAPNWSKNELPKNLRPICQIPLPISLFC